MYIHVKDIYPFADVEDERALLRLLVSGGYVLRGEWEDDDGDMYSGIPPTRTIECVDPHGNHVIVWYE
jgi:hypothetical protein